MTSRKTKQAAQNAVKTPPAKREPLPLTISEQMALASVHEHTEQLKQAQEELKQTGNALLIEICTRLNLDPKGLGKDYLIKNNAIVFEVK